jgi:hypothetical protein
MVERVKRLSELHLRPAFSAIAASWPERMTILSPGGGALATISGACSPTPEKMSPSRSQQRCFRPGGAGAYNDDSDYRRQNRFHDLLPSWAQFSGDGA